MSDRFLIDFAMDPIFPRALRYVRQVQAKIGGNRIRYDEFVQTLQLFRLKIMDSSTVISTIHTIFNDHPNLLDDFKPFIPTKDPAAAARAEADDAKVRSCLDFLNRVGTRFNGGRAYRKLLEYCIHARARGEKDTSDRVSRLFGENYHLFDEFLRFLPDGEGSTRQYFTRGAKRSRDDEETFACDARPRRTSRKQKVVDKDGKMEVKLCKIDVKIEKLEGCSTRAKYLHDDLTGNELSPANVRLHWYFTPYDLAGIRKLGERFLEDIAGENMVHALTELDVAL